MLNLRVPTASRVSDFCDAPEAFSGTGDSELRRANLYSDFARGLVVLTREQQRAGTSVVLINYCYGQTAISARDYVVGQYQLFANCDAYRHGDIQPSLSELRPAWLVIAESEVDELSFSQMREVVISLDLLMKNRRFGDIDDGLRLANPIKMCPDAVTAVARTTYSARSDLQAWGEFVAKATVAMRSRGEPDELMDGLV